MTAGAEASEPSGSSAPWARLLERHRAAWTEELLEGWSIVDLAAASDPIEALSGAPDRTAFVWLDGYIDAAERDRLRATLKEAGRRSVPIVVGFEIDPDGHATREAEALLESLEGARLVTQELAAGSLIAQHTSERATAARARSVHSFVCANVEAAALERSSTELAAAAEPVMTGYVAWLDQANRELRAANARLGRERLGVHDAAAAAVETRRLALEERITGLEEQLEEWQGAAKRNHEELLMARRALEAPRYRAVDRVRELAFRFPGVALVLRLRSRRLGSRWQE